MKNKIHLGIALGLLLGFAACSRPGNQTGTSEMSPTGATSADQYATGNPNVASGPTTQESSTSTSTTSVSNTGTAPAGPRTK